MPFKLGYGLSCSGGYCAPFQFAQIANLVAHWDATYGVYTSGSRQFTAANSEYFTLADNATVTAGDIDFWLAAWVYIDAKPANDMDIISKWDADPNNEYTLQFEDTADRFRLVVSNDGTAAATLAADTLGSPSTATWYFIFAWHEPTENKLYIRVNNGGIDSTAHTTGVYGGGSSAFLIGAQQSGGPGVFWDGRIARAAMGKPPTALGDGTAGTLANTISTRLYNEANGLLWNQITSAERTAWGLVPGSGVYYELNEPSGNAIDSVSLTQGSRQFTAANTEYFTLADNATVSAGDVDFWCGCWFYADSLPGERGLFGHYNSGSAQRSYLLNSNATQAVFYVSSDGSSTTTAIASQTFSTGRWYFALCYHDAANDEIGVSIDGGAFTTSAHSTGVHNSTADLQIGAFSAGSSPFNGRIARAAFGKIPSGTMNTLAATIRDALFNGGRGVKFADLSAAQKSAWGLTSGNGVYYNLDEESGNAIDAVAGLNATDTNTVTANPAGPHLSATDTNTVTAANGPATSLATDSTSNANHGTLTGYSAADEQSSWSSSTADDTGEPTAFEEQANAHGTLEGYTEAQLSDGTNGWLTPQGLKFDGVNDYVSIVDQAHSLTTLSVSCKVKTTANNNKLFFSHWDSGTSQRSWTMALAPTSWTTAPDGNEFAVSLSTSGTAGTGAEWVDTNVADGVEHTLGFTFDSASGTLKLYIDGVVQTTVVELAVAATALHNSTANMTIGSGLSAGAWAAGIDATIRDCRIHNSVLTDAQMLAIHNESGQPTPDWHWNLTQPGGTRSLPVLGAGTSLQFDGTDDFVVSANGGALLSSVSQRSYVFWFFRDNAADEQCFAIGNATQNDRVYLRFWQTGGDYRVQVVEQGSTARNLSSSLFSETGLWSHFVVTVDSGANETKLYLNGVLVVTDTTSISALQSTLTRLWMGSRESTAFFTGKLDDVRIYNTALTAAEVLHLYTEGARGTDPTTTNLVGHWKLDDGPQQAVNLSDGDRVTLWEDRVARYQMVQTDAAKNPTFRIINGQKSVQGDGTDDLLRYDGDLSTATVGTLVLVYELLTASGSPDLFCSSDEAGTNDYIDARVHYNAGNPNPGVVTKNSGTANAIKGSTTVATTDYVVVITTDGSTWSIRINGNDETESVVSGSNTGDWLGDIAGRDNVTLFALKRTTESQFTNARLRHAVLYDRELTSAEIAQIEAVYP